MMPTRAQAKEVIVLITDDAGVEYRYRFKAPRDVEIGYEVVRDGEFARFPFYEDRIVSPPQRVMTFKVAH
jgi:hypothetical protein